MGRIEDNEADRIERARQEAQAAAKRIDAKRIDESRQFGAVVQKAQDTKKSGDKKESDSKQKEDSANQKLLSRRGIAANQTTVRLGIRGKEHNEKSRQQSLERESGRLKKGALEHKRDVLAKTTDNGGGAIRRTTHKGGADSQSQQESAKDKGQATSEPQAGREAFVQAMGQAVAPLAGLGTEVRGSAGAPTMLSAKEIVDEIVARVHQGVDQHGFGLIEFDLRDNVLAGSRLTLHATPDGVAIKFQTGDKEVADLLSSTGTGKMLATAMAQAKVPLKGLEVNGKEVKYI